MTFINFYKVLNIPSKASPLEIKAAYRRLAKIWHPDRNQGSKSSEDRFKEIQSAYQVLSNTNQKRQYDFKYKDEIHRTEEEETQTRPPQNPNTWKTADAYKSRLDRLWKQYENIHDEKNRTYAKRHNKKDDIKYYYYNNEKVTREEFQERTYQNFKQKNNHPQNPQEEKFSHQEDSRFDIFYMKRSDFEEFRKKIQVDQLLLCLGLLFVGALFFLMLHNTLLVYLGLMSLVALIASASISRSHINPKLANLIIELHSDKILLRGKDLHTTSIYFQNIAQIRIKTQGIYIYPKINNPQQPSFKEIFIPSVMQGYAQIYAALNPYK